MSFCQLIFALLTVSSFLMFFFSFSDVSVLFSFLNIFKLCLLECGKFKDFLCCIFDVSSFRYMNSFTVVCSCSICCVP